MAMNLFAAREISDGENSHDWAPTMSPDERRMVDSICLKPQHFTEFRFPSRRGLLQSEQWNFPPPSLSLEKTASLSAESALSAGLFLWPAGAQAYRFCFYEEWVKYNRDRILAAHAWTTPPNAASCPRRTRCTAPDTSRPRIR
jgi:hypothetical protein